MGPRSLTDWLHAQTGNGFELLSAKNYLFIRDYYMFDWRGRTTFVISLLATGVFLVAVVKFWNVPELQLVQLLLLSVGLLSGIIIVAWLVVKLVGDYRLRRQAKKQHL